MSRRGSPPRSLRGMPNWKIVPAHIMHGLRVVQRTVFR
jgi:hypothetical protein